jgi:hypothetical protein
MRIAAALALAAAALALAGCGGGRGPLAAAAAKSRDAGGVHVTTTVTLTFANGGQGVITGSGVFTGDDGALGVDMSNLLQNSPLPIGSGGGIGVRYLTEGGDPVMYLRLPFLASQLPPGKQWIRVDLRRAAGGTGLNFDRLLGPAGRNPAQVLGLLAAAGAAKKVGPDIVDGRKATQYHATIDLRKGLRAEGVPDAEVARLLSGGATADMPVDVWIGDDDGLVHQLRTSSKTDVEGQTVSMTTLTRFTDWGADVRVAPPPSRRVYDATPPSAAGAA